MPYSCRQPSTTIRTLGPPFFDFEDVFARQNVHALLALEVCPDLVVLKSVVLTVYPRLPEVYLIRRRGLGVGVGNDAG